MIGAEAEQGTLAERAARLFDAYRGGEESKVEELIELLTPILWHTVRGQRLDRQSAEDVLQVTWMTLLRHAESIKDSRAVLQWLIVTSRRQAWQVMRRQSKVELRESTEESIPVPRSEHPDEVIAIDDDRERLWAHIGQLSEKCRHLLRVIAFADKPDYAEIAQALGMPVGSIGPTRGRCLAKLRAQLDHDPRWDG